MSTNKIQITGQVVNIFTQQIISSTITIDDGIISSIEPLTQPHSQQVPFIIPGFVDSHVHIESSLLVPSEFARLAVLHGTVATVSDPHEIANVCSIAGVEYMIENGKQANFKFNFGAPSCVPATTFETAGATLDSDAVDELMQRKEIKYLSEVMNYPAVLSQDEEMIRKMESAKKLHKPIDGHAPGVRGKDAEKYIQAGISTDHECFEKEEAAEKLSLGMKVLIREGSAAKNFDALIELAHEHWQQMMFCSDDKHPDSLALSHINNLCKRAVEKGIDVFKVLWMACVHPVLHYNLEVGLLRVGDPADLVLLNNLNDFEVIQTYINGKLVADNGQSLIPSTSILPINNFDCSEIIPEVLAVAVEEYPYVDGKIWVMEALEGQLITNKLLLAGKIEANNFVSDTSRDILKIVVVNRYHNAPIAKAFIKNIGLKTGAIASSVAHDSHNIVAVGVDDESLAKAINLVINAKGGLSAVWHIKSENQEKEFVEKVLPLPIAGLMSNLDAWAVSKSYSELDKVVKSEMKSKLQAPFMTLSFMALLVIPHLKLSDKGLFDGDQFKLLAKNES